MLLGRDDEIDLLRSRLAAINEHGSVQVIRGDPGIGKSSLLQWQADSARDRGFVVLRTTGVETEARLPFAALQQLLRPVIGAGDRLLPSQRRCLYTALGLDLGPPPELFAVAMAVQSLLSSVARRYPVAVVIDDLQWLDDASVSALGFVARRIADVPISMLAAIRTGHRVPTWSDFANLQLLPLDAEGSRRLVTASGAGLSTESIDRILRLACGNPLALVELPSVWRPNEPLSAEEIPLSARLERAFGHRIAALPADTREVLLIAAIDEEGELGEIFTAAGILAGRPIGIEALEPAELAGLVQLGPTWLQFRHPLIRSAVQQAESRKRRHAANAALAAALPLDPFRRSWYRSRAIIGPSDEVADELEANHDECIRRGSVRIAISALERAAQLTSDPAGRGRRLLLAAELAFTLGQVELVARLIEAARRTRLSELDLIRVEWLREIFHDGRPGDARRVHQLCGHAALAAGAGDTDLALNLLLGAALRCWWADPGAAARAEVAASARCLTGVQLDARYVATLAVAEPIACAAEVGSLLARVVIESVVDADALRLLGLAAHAIGDQVMAADFLDRAQRTCRAEGRLGLLAQVLGLLGSVLLDLGDWRRAVAVTEEGRRVAADTGQPIWHTGILVNEARAAGLAGNSRLALDLAEQADRSMNSHPLNDFLACAQLARGFALISDGRYPEAFLELSRLFDPSDVSHHQREQFGGVMFLAEAAFHVGEQRAAGRVLDGLEQLAAGSGSRLLQVQLLYARAVLADDADADRLFVSALGADLASWPWVRARLELAYGSWLRRHRRITESRRYLRSAQDRLARIGAAGWVRQATVELEATGAGTSLPSGPVRDLLSAQEFQIAVLASAGLSNREIGSRLFLSPRTIGSHLYRIFPKLDIHSRGQLAARIGTVERGWGDPNALAERASDVPRSQPLFGQPVQASVGDVLPAGIDGQRMSTAGELE
jgi:DNA-binding CsgD family transcriptional regulator